MPVRRGRVGAHHRCFHPIGVGVERGRDLPQRPCGLRSGLVCEAAGKLCPLPDGPRGISRHVQRLT